MPSPLHPLKPQHTVRGRVVYDRKPHWFSEADLLRIGKSIFFRSSGEASVLKDILYRVSMYFLRIILDLFGAGVFASVVYLYLTDMVAALLDGLYQLALSTGSTEDWDYLAEAVTDTDKICKLYLPNIPEEYRPDLII